MIIIIDQRSLYSSAANNFIFDQSKQANAFEHVFNYFENALRPR